MKHIILSICLYTYIIFFVGCKKDNIKKISDSSSSIVGSWELRQAQYGMIPASSYASGNGNILKFTSTDYQLYSNAQLVKSGKYIIVRDATAVIGECIDITSGRYLNRLTFDNNRNDSKRIEITSNNKLTFISGCSALDSGSYTEYEKQ
jgi:hypothetical protein